MSIGTSPSFVAIQNGGIARPPETDVQRQFVKNWGSPTEVPTRLGCPVDPDPRLWLRTESCLAKVGAVRRQVVHYLEDTA